MHVIDSNTLLTLSCKVFQEAIVAQEITVLLGEKEWSWDEISKLHDDIFDWAVMIEPRHNLLDVSVHLTLFNSIRDAKTELANTEHINFVDYLDSLADSQQFQDPRDRFFGLLGFAGNAFPPEFVDYENPISDLFRDGTR